MDSLSVQACCVANDNYSLKILAENIMQRKIQAINRGGQNSFSDLCLFVSELLQFVKKSSKHSKKMLRVLLKGFYGLGKK